MKKSKYYIKKIYRHSGVVLAVYIGTDDNPKGHKYKPDSVNNDLLAIHETEGKCRLFGGHIN